MIRLTSIVLGLFIVVLFAYAPIVEAESKFPPNERLKVPSFTFSNEQFLRGNVSKGTPVTLVGELRLPNWDTNLPAVILLHGSDGFTSSPAYQWGEFINSIGIATFRALHAFDDPGNPKQMRSRVYI